MSDTPATYCRSQIWLHWIVVIGVILQNGFNSAIVAVVDAREAGQTAADADMTRAMFHVSIGFIILLAVIARLGSSSLGVGPAPSLASSPLGG